MTLAHATHLRREAGRELRALRLAAGLHPADLGIALGSTRRDTAAQRVSALENGTREPDAATCATLRTLLGALPDGWERARTLEAAVNRARASVIARELDLLADVLPRLVARRDRTLRHTGWCAVPIHAPMSGTTITGGLPLTLGTLVHGCGPGGPLHATREGVPVWILGAGGSLLSGRGTIHTLQPAPGRAAWHTDGTLDQHNVGGAWHALRQARDAWRQTSGDAATRPTRWSLTTIAVELGIPIAPVTLTDADGATIARWDPRSGALRDARGHTRDTVPHPDDDEAWAARPAPASPERRAGWFEDARGEVVAIFDGWLPDGLVPPPQAHAEAPTSAA
jgi:transcriptional regulator with XRE-family HTH domain